MRPVARKLMAIAVLLVVPLMFSGCIVSIWDDCWSCGQCPPRRAQIHVYVYDYYTGAPVPWAVAELYKEHWWHWSLIGSWHVDPGGYARLYGGCLYRDGCGGPEEKEYKIAVYASEYCSESFSVELSYYYPSETLYFYLWPWCGTGRGRDGQETDAAPGVPNKSNEERPGEISVGEPRGKDCAGLPMGESRMG